MEAMLHGNNIEGEGPGLDSHRAVDAVFTRFECSVVNSLRLSLLCSMFFLQALLCNHRATG